MEPLTDWDRKARGIIKAEMKRRDLSYQQLAERLEAIGVHDTQRNLINKVNRGKFSAAFLLQCLEAIGCSRIEIA
jgi:hypothetical protein